MMHAIPGIHMFASSLVLLGLHNTPSAFQPASGGPCQEVMSPCQEKEHRRLEAQVQQAHLEGEHRGEPVCCPVQRQGKSVMEKGHPGLRIVTAPFVTTSKLQSCHLEMSDLLSPRMGLYIQQEPPSVCVGDRSHSRWWSLKWDLGGFSMVAPQSPTVTHSPTVHANETFERQALVTWMDIRGTAYICICLSVYQSFGMFAFVFLLDILGLIVEPCVAVTTTSDSILAQYQDTAVVISEVQNCNVHILNLVATAM